MITALHSQRVWGILAILAATFGWSLGGLGIKLLDASPQTIAGWRSIFASIVLVVAMWGRKQPWAKPSLAGWIAIFAYVCMAIGFVGATRTGSSSVAILVQFSGAVWVAPLAAWLLRESLRWVEIVAMAGCLLGLWIMLGTGSLTPAIGFALVASICFAVFPVALRVIHLKNPAVSLISLVLAGNLMLIMLCLPWIPSGFSTTKEYFIVAGLGIFQIGIPYLLYLEGVRRLRAMESTLLCAMEPMLSPFWVWWGIGEVPAISAVWGGLLIVISSILPSLRSQPPSLIIENSHPASK